MGLIREVLVKFQTLKLNPFCVHDKKALSPCWEGLALHCLLLLLQTPLTQTHIPVGTSNETRS